MTEENRIALSNIWHHMMPLGNNGLRPVKAIINIVASQRHQTLYDKSLSVLGPRLWKTIPTKLTKVRFQQQFKNSLTNYLLLIPDKPPVLGYCCPVELE